MRDKQAEEPKQGEEPPIGSFASVAREMSKESPDFDWDDWKDQMKNEM